MDEPFLGVVLTYPNAETKKPVLRVYPNEYTPADGSFSTTGAGVLGAGIYAKATFLPAAKRVGGIPLIGIASASGLNARHAAQKFGFQYATADENEILNGEGISHVAILTRHNDHARQVITALHNGKHVYCEKPLALNATQLNDIEAAVQADKRPHADGRFQPPLCSSGCGTEEIHCCFQRAACHALPRERRLPAGIPLAA